MRREGKREDYIAMRVSFSKYPIDIIICILWSLILVPVVLFDVNESLRVILGLPALLFIPGYILIFALFPTTYDGKGIDIIERIALSFGLSIAVVPLLGLGLNYTPWGIRLIPILTALIAFISIIGLVALFRWFKTSANKRFIIDYDFHLPKTENRLDQALTLILAISILVAIISLVYVIVIPKTGETFTEFYLLGPDGIADNYPKNMSLGENRSVIVGVVNHEYKQMNYTIEIWAVNQSLIFNETSQENETMYHHMWYLDAKHIQLNHTPVDIEGEWQPQWEYNWTFSLKQKGMYKLCFLLYLNSNESYQKEKDYVSIAEEKINDAYREVHLWISVEQ